VKKKVILTTYSPLLYAQNMSEPEERPYAGIDEEQKQEELHEGEETTEEKREGVEAIRTTEEEVAKEKAPELEEEKVKVNVKQTRKKKMAPKSKRKDEKLSITGVAKQLEKQTNYLARLEQVLKPLVKLGKGLDLHSKIVKEIATSVKQLERQILQIQKTIKEKTRGK
jgi:hypothetical protein